MRKSAVLRSVVKASLPLRGYLRQIKRSVRPYEDTPANSTLAVKQGIYIIECLRAQGVDVTGDVMELGAGWLPIVPLLFHLAGTKHLILTDVERLMDFRTLARAKVRILENLSLVATALRQSEASLSSRLSEGFAPDYVVPWDSRSYLSSSVDIIYSRAVLEHIPPFTIEQMFADFGRILRPTGAMCHVIDNSDHWEHHDKTLSRVDFLRYEEGFYWKLATLDPQAYQNRLRHSDYLRLFRKHDWTVAFVDGNPDERCLVDLQTLPLARRFRSYPPQDLAVLTSTFVLLSEGSREFLHETTR